VIRCLCELSPLPSPHPRGEAERQSRPQRLSPKPFQGGRSAARPQRPGLRSLPSRRTAFPRSPALDWTHNECAPLLKLGQGVLSEIARFTRESGLGPDGRMGPSNVGVIVKRCAGPRSVTATTHSPGRGGVRYRGTSRKCRAWAVSLARFSAARSRDLIASRAALDFSEGATPGGPVGHSIREATPGHPACSP
jgi:hypothetical protein